MSIYKGSTLISGAGQFLPLLTFMWADHQLNNISWLRADTFSWQDGSVYTAVYNHLVADISGKTAQSETIGSTTISFYLADDGHKITTDESAVASIYTETGVAWYYILDTTNTRFKLPRTQFGFTGYRDTVGAYVGAGLPNITGALTGQHSRSYLSGSYTSTSALYRGSNSSGYTGNYSESSAGPGLYFDASRSNSIYGNSTTVQPKATQMYLYFYVGQFTQSAIAQTAGITSETLALKVDKGHQVIEFQEPTSSNNYTWYRKYADGWVEQGGRATVAQDTRVTVTMAVTMADTNYQILITANSSGTTRTGGDGNFTATPLSTTQFYWMNGDDFTSTNGWWQVSGMYAQ